MTESASNIEAPELTSDAYIEPKNLTQDELMRVVRVAMPGAVVGIAVLASLYTMYFAADLIVPVFLALFLSIILRPMVRGLQHIGLPQSVSALIVLFGLVGAIISSLVNLSAPAEQWLHRLPSIQRDIEAKIWPVTKSIKQATEATANIGKIADATVSTPKKSEVTIKSPSYFDHAFKSTLLTSVQFLIIVALTFFFLTQNSLQAQALPKIPWLKHNELIVEMLASVQATITRILQISAGINVIIGTITGLAMYGLGMPNPVLWGVLAAVLGFMPYVGPTIVFGCIGVVSLLTFESWWQILMPPFAYGILTIAEGNFVTPAILGQQLKLNPIAIFLSMLLWTWIWGLAGAILAVPILVIVMIVTRHIALMIRKTDGEPTAKTISAHG